MTSSERLTTGLIDRGLLAPDQVPRLHEQTQAMP